MPKTLKTAYECALRCQGMTQGDRAKVEGSLRQAGCDPKNPGSHVLCAATPEQVCVGACGSGQQDMTTWLPGAFGSSSPGVSHRLAEVHKEYDAYGQCADECSRKGVAVDVKAQDAESVALATLKRCGVVQLVGSYDAALLAETQEAIDALAKKKAYKKLEDRKQLHDGRFQVYLPYAEPFNRSRAVLGVNDFVANVLAGYFGAHGFGIDHVSVLTSSSPSKNQSLHPDVSYFKGLTVSVHTALVDVTSEMGPTYFCPCTGEVGGEGWPASSAIKVAILQSKACFGPTFAPAFTAKGTTTIYDGALFHMGLGNNAGRDRPVLKLEVGAAGYPARRNYIQLASPAAKKQTHKFREALGPPRMGDPPM